jgi:hypothetical protein
MIDEPPFEAGLARRQLFPAPCCVDRPDPRPHRRLKIPESDGVCGADRCLPDAVTQKGLPAMPEDHLVEAARVQPVVDPRILMGHANVKRPSSSAAIQPAQPISSALVTVSVSGCARPAPSFAVATMME